MKILLFVSVCPAGWKPGADTVRIYLNLVSTKKTDLKHLLVNCYFKSWAGLIRLETKTKKNICTKIRI